MVFRALTGLAPTVASMLALVLFSAVLSKKIASCDWLELSVSVACVYCAGWAWLAADTRVSFGSASDITVRSLPANVSVLLVGCVVIASSIDGVLDCSELLTPKATEQTAKAKIAASIRLSFNRSLKMRARRLRHHGLVFLSAMGVACRC